MTRAPRWLLTALIAAGLAGSAAPAQAQAPDTSAVQAAAFTGVRADFPGTARVVLEGALHPRTEILRCQPRDPASCHLVGADVLVRLRIEALASDSARVIAVTWAESGHRHRPVVRKTRLLRLSRTAEGWVVVSSEELSVS